MIQNHSLLDFFKYYNKYWAYVKNVNLIIHLATKTAPFIIDFAHEIDCPKGYKFRNKEFQQIVRDANLHKSYEEDKKMPYITTAERIGREEKMLADAREMAMEAHLI